MQLKSLEILSWWLISWSAYTIKCKDDILRGYYEKYQSLINEFRMVTIRHIPRARNQEANRIAQGTFGYRQIEEILSNKVVASD
jgi:hypothetical protein